MTTYKDYAVEHPTIQIDEREYDLQRSWAAEEIADAIELSDDDLEL